jgi:biopolymer transport protein ExbB
MSEALGQFLARGGVVMPLIFVLSFLMWLLILDRYRRLHLLTVGPSIAAPDPDQTQRLHGPRVARRLHRQQVADLAVDARRYLPLIRTLIQTLPLLGLLGTVSGLIHCFEGIALFGENNRRAVASGIAEALIATLSGLVTALSGLYFSVDLEQRAARLRARAEHEGCSP